MKLAARFLLSTFAVGVPFAWPAAGPIDAMRVHFIDVGQGAATLVEFPCGAALIDTGGERWPTEGTPVRYHSTPALMAYLNAFFVTRPDLEKRLALLVLSHPHKDHTRAVPQVIAAFKPRSVVFNGQTHGSGIEEQAFLRTYATEPDVRSWFVLRSALPKNFSNAAIDPIACDPTDPQIRVLWGQVRDDSGWDPHDFSDENNHSVVMRIDYGEASFLFTGDLEEAKEPEGRAGIERLIDAHQASNLLDVDVYHVGHHGSHNGTSPALLNAMSPEIAVISAGPACLRDGFSAWTHGHPRTVTVNDLEAAVTGTRAVKSVRVFPGFQTQPVIRKVAKAIYSTGWDGTIVLEGRPNGSWSTVTMTGSHPCLKQ